ncbi:hypothetical protein [Streptomyces sp. NPDC046909]|uniref:hypothetical protein n=1 Tax=Streptomyces sp. NPDC046909 TaxID=3155617 RepID=UPI00340CAA9E
MLVIWVGGMVTPVLRRDALEADDSAFLATLLQAGSMLFACGLIGGSELGEWFHRRDMGRQAVEQADRRGRGDHA